MSCVHLKKLFELCDENELRFSSRDLVHIVCTQCQKQEVCPSLLVNEEDADEQIEHNAPTAEQAARPSDSR